MLNKLRAKKLPGFTLLELVVVIVVIGILAAIAIPTLQGVIDRANTASAQTTLQAITHDAEVIYAMDGGSTPADWYAAYATAVAETPGAVTFIQAETAAVIVIDKPVSDITDVATYQAAVEATGAATPLTGASTPGTISVSVDEASNLVGAAYVTSSNNCVFSTTLFDNTQVQTLPAESWSLNESLGSNCKGTVALLGQAETVSTAETLALTGSTASTPPTTLTAQTQPGAEATLTWSAATSNQEILSYEIFVNGESYDMVDQNQLNYHDYPGINMVGQSVTYKVRAVLAGETVTAFSNEETLTLVLGGTYDAGLAAPELTAGSADANYNSDLSWTLVPGATKYFVTATNGVGQSATVYQFEQTTAQTFQFFTNPSLSPVNVSISAYTEDGRQGPASNTVTFTRTNPFPPTAFVAQNGDDGTLIPVINLSWNPAPVLSIDGVRVYRSTSNAGPFILRTTLVGDNSSFQDFEINYSTPYYYEIETYDASGTSTRVSSSAAESNAQYQLEIVPQSSGGWGNQILSNGAGTVLVDALNGSTTLRQSTDNGATWTNIGTVPGPQLSLAGSSDLTTLYSATQTGVHVSTDTGQTWASNAQTDFYTAVASSSTGQYAVAVGQGSGAAGNISVTNDFGATWTRHSNIFNQSANKYASMSQDGSVILIGRTSSFTNEDNGVYLSTDYGQTWSKKIPNAINQSYQYNGVSVSPDGQTLLVSSGNQYLSKDQGQTWSTILQGVASNGQIFVNNTGTRTLYSRAQLIGMSGTGALPDQFRNYEGLPETSTLMTRNATGTKFFIGTLQSNYIYVLTKM